MLRNILKNKLKFISTFVLGICVLFGTSIPASANSNSAQVIKAEVQSSDKEKLLLDKQSQIDKFVFEQHAKDIEQKGFKVTHTGQVTGYVEVGITPFTKENADYLYSLFGKELVKVVEGHQIQLMNGAASTTSVQENNAIKPRQIKPLIYVVIAAAAAGGIFLISQKQRIKR